MAVKLIIIRHAETRWSRNKRYCGLNDISLSGVGIKQTRELRKRLKEDVIYKVYSSDMQRAIQTAKILFGQRDIERMRDLREMDFGIFEGLTYKEIMKRYPLIYKRWLDNPYIINIPNGENLTAFKKRVVGAFKKISALNKNKTIAVVSHGGAISIFINTILKTNNFWAYIPKPAGLSIIEYSNGKPEIKVFNH